MTVTAIIEKPAARNAVVLENIRLNPDVSRLMDRFRFTGKGHLTSRRILTLWEVVLREIEPRAVYRAVRISSRRPGGLEIERVRFDYPLLRYNLDKAGRIFAFCLTVVDRLEALISGSSDAEERHCLTVIEQLVVSDTLKEFQSYLLLKYHLPYIWSLVVGEMQAWPSAGHPQLFQVLGDPEPSIGVRLQPDFSLLPASSCAGFFYFTETEFEGCQVCSKEPCMMRRAQYNAELADQKGLKVRKVCGRDTA
jgi:hypothetical protein